MKNLNRLFRECVSEAMSINLDISENIINVTVNTRLSRALGRCCASYRVGGGYNYRIEVNPCMLADDLDDRIPKNTIMHELVHTCPGCLNHGWDFQHRAMMINRKLGYNVQTTTDGDALEAKGVKLKRPVKKYGIVCKKCGEVIGSRARWSSTLDNIGKYRHTGCGGDVYVICIDGSQAAMTAANIAK